MKCNCWMIHPPDGRKARNMANAGMSKNPTYKTWIAIRTRCRKHTAKGRSKVYQGVKISADWSEDYLNFLSDMGPRPSKHMSIDRINGNHGYCKHNCRWATKYQQALNRRNVNFNNHVSPGVRRRKNGSYEARINILNRMFHIGTFATRQEAEAEYIKYRKFIYRK